MACTHSHYSSLLAVAVDVYPASKPGCCNRLEALLTALPPEQALAVDSILSAQATGNTAADLSSLQSAIGPAVGVPVPSVVVGSSDRKLLRAW